MNSARVFKLDLIAKAIEVTDREIHSTEASENSGGHCMYYVHKRLEFKDEENRNYVIV